VNEIKIPTQTICLVKGKINVGEPCTLLDLKRMIDAYPRNAHREMQVAIDEMLDGLEIEDPAWVPSAIGTFVFVHLCEKAPEEQKDALVKAVLTSLCSGIPDIVLSTCFVSISKGTLWADAKAFAASGILTDGNLNLQFPSDPNFSKDGEWIGGFPVETKANPELN
jgi:hypothetical protein